MKIKFSFLENEIVLNKENVFSLEIESKDYFYRIVNILNNYSLDEIIEEIFDKNYKIKLFIDYFNLDINNKKTLNNIIKLIEKSCDEIALDNLTKSYQKILRNFNNIINNIDINLSLNNEFSINNINKMLDIKIELKNNLLSNLITIIDVNKELKEYDLLIFINLKQYLSKEEIIELYKYAIYNNNLILLIDSQSYGTTVKYEKKLLIDENLEEFML